MTKKQFNTLAVGDEVYLNGRCRTDVGTKCKVTYICDDRIWVEPIDDEAIIAPRANAIGDRAAMEARRETIIYQLKNKTFENDNNLGTTEVLSAVADYNGDVLKMRAGRKNPWINWFYAPYGEDLELIELDDFL